MTVLKDYIDGDGLVDYTQLKEDLWLKDHIKRIEAFKQNNMSKEERFAFWLNAYNLLVLKGVCLEVEKNPSWKGNMSRWNKSKFFYLRKFNVAGRKLNLYYIENRILRKEFKDPRIHFTINCASRSCPILPRKLFEESTLESYLDDLTRIFINDENNIKYNEEDNTLCLNRIFKWYSKDFLSEGGVIEFILKYLDRPIDHEKFQNAKIEYFDYDWSLNSQPASKTLFIPSVR
ncbi:MAG: DUF547 domain-containing protein [Candidatus Hodarchaeota archaeon]